LALPPAEIERVAKTVGFHEHSGEIARDVAARSAPSVPPRAAGGC
jgi:hypothetical protein